MKLTALVFSTLFLHQGYASEGTDPLNKLTPKNAGDIHNKIMMQVNDRMAHEFPEDYNSFSKIALEEMLTLCKDGDHECEQSVRSVLKGSSQRVQTLQIAGEIFDINSVLPDELDDDIRGHLQSIHDAIHLVSDSHVNDVIGVINGISDSVENSDANEMMKAVVMSAASVAAGSTKYWMSAREDPDNSFRKLHENSRRALEGVDGAEKSLISLLVEPAGIIIADFIGFVVGAIAPAIEWVLAGGIASPIPIIAEAVVTSIADSIEATGITIPQLSAVIRCILEDLMTPSNCSVRELFCNETDVCKN